MGKGLVYSGLFGRRSPLLPVGVTEPNVDYVMFTDEKPAKAKGWKIVLCADRLDPNPRMESRFYKWGTERIGWNDYDWVLWVDSTHNLSQPVDGLVRDVWLKDHDIAAFSHPIRDCSYAEIPACLGREKETRIKLDRVRKHLDESGLPKNAGLFALGSVARRPTAPIANFSDSFVQRMLRFTARDQLLFVPHLLRWDLKCHPIQGGDVYHNEFFAYHGPHG